MESRDIRSDEKRIPFQDAWIYEKGGCRARDPKTGKLWSEVARDKASGKPDEADRPTGVGARVLARMRFWQSH
jgi:hypothetical protein